MCCALTTSSNSNSLFPREEFAWRLDFLGDLNLAPFKDTPISALIHAAFSFPTGYVMNKLPMYADLIEDNTPIDNL